MGCAWLGEDSATRFKRISTSSSLLAEIDLAPGVAMDGTLHIDDELSFYLNL